MNFRKRKRKRIKSVRGGREELKERERKEMIEREEGGD